MEKEAIMQEKEKTFHNRKILEREISMACDEITDINPEMFAESKVL